MLHDPEDPLSDMTDEEIEWLELRHEYEQDQRLERDRERKNDE